MARMRDGFGGEAAGDAPAGAEAPECKGCSTTVHITPEEMAQIFSSTLRIKAVKLASEAEYERRLAVCRTCEAFQFGTTCRWCGCLMQVKAKLRAASCPAPEGDKWAERGGEERKADESG